MNIGTKIGAIIAHFAESTEIKISTTAVRITKAISSGSTSLVLTVVSPGNSSK